MKTDRLRASDLLADLPWLKGLSPRLPELLVREGRLEHYKVGRWRQAAGDEGNALTVVIKGTVALYCQGSADQVVRFTQVGAGAAFGHSLPIGRTSNITAVCVKPTLVLSIPQSTMLRLSETEPDVRVAALRLVYLNSQALQEMLADVIGLPTRQRLASCLLRLNKDEGRPGWITITQGSLAEMIGTTRKTASQFLTEFERTGWIELGYNRLRILNRPALRRALQDG